MDNNQSKALALVAGAIGVSALIYRLCRQEKRDPKNFVISGTASAAGSLKRDHTHPELDIWIDRLEAAIEVAAFAYQTWQNVKKRSS